MTKAGNKVSRRLYGQDNTLNAKFSQCGSEHKRLSSYLYEARHSLHRIKSTSFRGCGLFCLLLGLFGLDGATLVLGGFSHNLDLSCTILFHFKLIGRCAGEVDNALLGIRSTIINRDLDLFLFSRLVTSALVPIGKLG